jgi:hypothetical protein
MSDRQQEDLPWYVRAVIWVAIAVVFFVLVIDLLEILSVI